MCFSAEVSFGAAAVISTIGVVAYKKANTKELKLYALIPILFGAQQFFEGIVWLGKTYAFFESWLPFATYGFMFFAWLIWPFYIPYTLLILEKKEQRKKILKVITGIGIAIVGLLLFVTSYFGIEAAVVDCSIKYNMGLKTDYVWVVGMFYVITTTVSNFISSVRRVWILGIMNILSYFIAKIYFNDHIISIWCFLAAISSLVVLWIVATAIDDAEKETD